MGMAASQARFLSLTARKSNIEYEGQQINQQRTTLANQSANLYNQMLTLNVPTPPNVQDYTRLVYTFKVPGVNSVATVSQFTKNPDTGKYTVSFTYSTEEIGSIACTNEQKSSIEGKVKVEDVLYTDELGYVCNCVPNTTENQEKQIYVDSEGYLRRSAALGAGESVYTRDETSDTYIKYQLTSGVSQIYYPASSKNEATKYENLPNNSSGKTFFTAQYNPTASLDKRIDQWQITTYKGKQLNLTQYAIGIDTAHKDVYNDLKKKYGNKSDFTMFYANIGTESSPVYTYYVGSDLTAGYAEPEDVNKKSIYYTVGEYDVYHQATYENCTLTRDANNRVLSIGYDGEDISVSSITETDKASYDDAMNEYTYKSYLYEQEMNNINAKTSVIQQQDKTLELRLKQLDTEESAIKAEMEAVKGVVKDNIDRSFKTFA